MSKTSAKNTTIGTFEVLFFNLPIYQLNHKTKGVRPYVIRDNSVLTRINQTLADRGHIERVELYAGGLGVRLMRGKTVVAADNFPAWNAATCGVEFFFMPAKNA